MNNVYLIKDLARKTGHSVYTIKYYYKLGLIKEMGRSPYTNYRYFDDSSVARLMKVRDLRKKEYTLQEIKQLILKVG